MPILDIPAQQIALGDILGEGMRIWMIIAGYRHPNRYITVYWCPDNAGSLLSNNYQDDAHRITYGWDNIVRVIRSE